MVIKSSYPTIDIPDVDIPTFLFETERPSNFSFPRNRPLFIDAKTGRSLSLDQVHDQSRRFGQGLKEKWGWQKGDVLCIFSMNQIDMGVVIWGTHYALGVGCFPNEAVVDHSDSCKYGIQRGRVASSIAGF